MFCQPMIIATSESNAHLFFENNQKIKNKKTKSNKIGKINPSIEINHHLTGCKKALAHASKKSTTTMMLDMMKTRLVNFRSVAIEICKLQIFFICCAF